ncbi:MAG TPA: cell division protein FtsZ [Saprospiraceae bacterium]|nr:cell division protein FtsZ [Lewinellaceae bacterium]HRX29656.1 cell division protein FtsZ [Saprospiraceae bacterium]
MLFDLPKKDDNIIKVLGVGGGGGNAVAHMFNQGITGVDFAVCNTDKQAMDKNPVTTKIILGPNLKEGRGAGSIPEVGKQACIESIDEVRSFLNDGTKMLFITAGMGGGTGTGAAPIIAKAAKEMGILTVGIVTLPFKFEGLKRQRQAAEGLENLKKNVDSFLVISNDRLREIYGNLSLTGAFSKADDILTTAAKGIAEIITVPGIVNVDFEDVNTVMRNSGVTIMGNAVSEGEERARKAISAALNSPLLEDNDIRGAQHILLNITSGTKEMTMDEIGEITDYVQEEAGFGTDLIWGHCTDESLGEKISITLIATGFSEGSARKNQTTEVKKKVSLEENFQFLDEEVAPDFGYSDGDENHTYEFEDIPVVHHEEREVTNIESDDIRISKTMLQLSEERKKHAEMDSARREYLRKNVSKPLDNPKSIIDMENVPAYRRRNVELDELKKSSGSKLSNLSVDSDENGPVLRNNSFLYDNVD